MTPGLDEDDKEGRCQEAGCTAIATRWGLFQLKIPPVALPFGLCDEHYKEWEPHHVG